MTQIPAPVVARGRQALADAITAYDGINRLLRECENLIATAEVLLGGVDGDGDPNSEQHIIWNETTGHWSAQDVLQAIARRIGESTGCSGGPLDGQSPFALRRRFAHLLEPGPS